jgi:hypothetical protein
MGNSENSWVCEGSWGGSWCKSAWSKCHGVIYWWDDTHLPQDYRGKGKTWKNRLLTLLLANKSYKRRDFEPQTVQVAKGLERRLKNAFEIT